nr:MAG TPA: hypothetical protein [Caudoviricetes sp.]
MVVSTTLCGLIVGRLNARMFKKRRLYGRQALRF